MAMLVTVELLEVETGLWCIDCALPSGARIWFTTRTGPAMSLRSQRSCLDCDGNQVTNH
jgi:hypothetical protein